MKILRLLLIIGNILLTFTCTAQAFMEQINPNAVDLSGSPCTITLSSGQNLQGIIRGTSIMSNKILSISVHLTNGKKVKYKPDDLVSIKVKLPYRSVFDMVKESDIPINKDVLENINDQIYIRF